MKTYHFNQHYNIFGVAFLALTALTVYIIAYSNDVMGSANLAMLPLMFGVFLLGLFTGRPCLIIEETVFQYRRLPFGRLHLVELQVISKVEIDDKYIRVYCGHDEKPLLISCTSFNRDELPSIADYFQNLQTQ